MDQLIIIAERRATPSHKSPRFNRPFRHHPECSREKPPPDRGFFFDLVGVDHVGRMAIGRPNMSRARLVLVVAYRNGADRNEIVRAMVSDHRVLAGAFLDQGNYSTATTGLQVIGEGQGEDPLPAEVDDADGALLLRISLPVRFSAEVTA